MITIPSKNTLYKSVLALMLSASLIACGGSGKKSKVDESNNKKKETSNQQADSKKVIKLLTADEKASAASKKEEERKYHGTFYKIVTYKNENGKVLFVESLRGTTAGKHDDITLTRNSYNASGQLIKSSKVDAKNQDGTMARTSSDITYTYDGKKKTSVQTDEVYRSDGKLLKSKGQRITTKYDDQGNEIDSFSEKELQSDGNYARNSRTKVFTKNVGNIVSVLLLKYTDEVFKSGTLVKVTKNAKDPSKADKVVEFDADESGKIILGNYQNTHEYHSNGKIKTRVFSIIDYNSATDTITPMLHGETKYTYNDKGKETFYLIKKDTNNDGAIDKQEMRISEYAADGITLIKYTTGVDEDGDGNPNKLVYIPVTDGKADGPIIEEHLDNNGTVIRTFKVGNI